MAAIRTAAELLEDGGTLSQEDRRLLAEIDGARAQIEAQLAALRRAAQVREARYLGRTSLADLLPVLAADFPGLDLKASGETLPLPIAPKSMMIVLGQLLRNAAEHGAGRVVLAARTEAGRLTLDVSDDGHGISAGNEARIFEPFFTTRRGGTGMGLSVVRNLLAAHGAAIVLLPGSGSAGFGIVFRGDDCV
ncbi:MAG: sensor histidine kinase [Hoeflea sp.]|nr:sensor histidine kinase [Hoeflea sp.]